MAKALIQGTRICQLVADDATFEVHEDLKWVDVADSVTESDTYEDGVVVPFVTVEERRKLEDPLHACIENRMENYPSLGTFVDAYYWSKKDDDSKMTEWVAACAKVKSDFPKPE